MDAVDSIELHGVTRKSSIVGRIWGSSLDNSRAQERVEILSSFVTYCEAQREFEQVPFDDVSDAINSLKGFPDKRKSELRDGVNDTSSGISGSLQDSVLDLSVRCMFLTACSSPSAMTIGGGSIFRPRWKDSESLEEYLKRVFPLSRAPQQDLVAFRIGKLCAEYLRVYYSVQIQWTDHLSDHLILLRGEGWKRLYIFRHPRFLKVSLDTLGVDDKDMAHTILGALKLYAKFPQSYYVFNILTILSGCLPPSLLKETLSTLDIIFPVIGDRASRAILEREVQNHELDRYFLDRFDLDPRDHERPSDALDPTDVRSLYEKYPYWADRLYELWREADDPTPTTRIERWTEARRNPRFTYWCAVISIVIAILFGMIATSLAAVQVWITWCEWIEDPSVAQCGYKKANGG